MIEIIIKTIRKLNKLNIFYNYKYQILNEQRIISKKGCNCRSKKDCKHRSLTKGLRSKTIDRKS
jgi:hypothetical protein